jgi:hypothetical protein
MPLVFVHGVNNRKDTEYDNREKLLDQYFKQIALLDVVPDPSKVTIKYPYWGQFGARLLWAGASLPLEQNEAFGGAEEVFSAILSELAPDVIAPANQMLLTLARQELARAVDCLWAAASQTPTGPGETPAAVAAAARKSLAYARANPQPAWLGQVTNDDQFVERLLTEVDNWAPPATESFGGGLGAVWNRVKNAAGRLKDAAKGAVQAVGGAVAKAGTAATDFGKAAAGAVINPVVRKARPGLNLQASLFLGDVFQYLQQRDEPGGGKILNEVLAALDAGHAARQPGDSQLIVVGHSMGGNIAYDILSRLRTDMVCDVFVTVGSQVAEFAELGLLKAVMPQVDLTKPDEKRPLATITPNIKRWINVFDTADLFGYSAARVFGGTEDYAFSSNVTAFTAHSMYFYRPRFYQRLRARILRLGSDT